MTFAGWAEILFIALLAFIIIGPKDLPKVLFGLGRFVRTLRQLSAEFMAEFDTIQSVRDLEDKPPHKSQKANRKN